MKKVLVTGAAGRVGANVCLQLSNRGTQVRAVVLPGDPFVCKIKDLPHVEIVEADLTDMQSVTEAVKGCTHFIHLAAQLIRGNTPYDVFYEVNAFSTLRLLLAAVQNCEIERFVLASTDGTYCPGSLTRENPIKETNKQLPGDHYGTGKYLGEVILRNLAFQYDIPFSIVRFATVVSPEESLNCYRYEYVMRLCELGKKGKDCHLWPLFQGQPDMGEILRKTVPAEGNPALRLTGPKGLWTMHCADVRDIVQGVLLAYEHPKALGEDFMIAGPRTTSYGEACEIFERLGVTKGWDVEFPVTWLLDMDITKARTVLGFEPQWTFEKMVQSGLDMEKKGPEGFIPATVKR